jgi:hypothetical protein
MTAALHILGWGLAIVFVAFSLGWLVAAWGVWKYGAGRD